MAKRDKARYVEAVFSDRGDTFSHILRRVIRRQRQWPSMPLRWINRALKLNGYKLVKKAKKWFIKPA